MAYYYVKDANGVDTGTATGDSGRYATQQTGTFAGLTVAGYYPTIQTALAATTTPVAGDFIMVSDLHDYTQASSLSYAAAVFGVNVIAVNDTDIEASRRSGNRASEVCSSNSGTITLGSASYSGCFFSTRSAIDAGIGVSISDSSLGCGTSNDDCIRMNADGESALVENTVFDFTVAGSAMVALSAGGVFYGVNNSTSGAGQQVCGGGFNNGGGSLTLLDSDISSLTGTLFNNVGGDLAVDDHIYIRLDNCKIATGVAFTNEVFASPLQRALFTRCSDSSAAAEYQYHLHAYGGDVFDDASIYRNQDTAFTESSQKISYEMTTNSDASLANPLWFDFPMSQYVPLTTTSTLEFYITCATALTDKDIYVTVGYTDSTNKNETNNVISAPETVGGTLDLLATGTTLTADATSTWTGALANLYKIVIDCPTGADCQPTVKINVTKASTVLYIASEYGVS